MRDASIPGSDLVDQMSSDPECLRIGVLVVDLSRVLGRGEALLPPSSCLPPLP